MTDREGPATLLLGCRRRGLIIDLLLPEGRAYGLDVPDELVLVVEDAALIRDGDDLAGVADLLLRDAHGVLGDPEQRRRASH